jgi:hypothetical protein
MQALLDIVIRILEVAFLIGVFGSGVVIVWVFVDDLVAVRRSGKEPTGDTPAET